MGLIHEILVLITTGSSECSDKVSQMYSLARAFAAHTQCRNIDEDSEPN